MHSANQANCGQHTINLDCFVATWYINRMSDTPEKVKKPRKPRKIKVVEPKEKKLSANVVLITQLVEIPDPVPFMFWKKEATLAKKFLKLYGKNLLKLWLPKKLKSLAFLGYIDNLPEKIETCVRLSQYKPAEYEEVKLSDEKVGKDAIIKHKPRNIRQWLEEDKQKEKERP